MERKKIAIYHRIMNRENFEVAARDLLTLIYNTQLRAPGQERILYVDISGHRNNENVFDKDMLELQQEYGKRFLLQFVSEIHFPLYTIKNPNKQNNDVSEKIKIQ